MEWFMNLDPIVQVAITVCITLAFISSSWAFIFFLKDD